MILSRSERLNLVICILEFLKKGVLSPTGATGLSAVASPRTCTFGLQQMPPSLAEMKFNISVFVLELRLNPKHISNQT